LCSRWCRRSGRRRSPRGLGARPARRATQGPGASASNPCAGSGCHAGHASSSPSTPREPHGSPFTFEYRPKRGVCCSGTQAEQRRMTHEPRKSRELLRQVASSRRPLPPLRARGRAARALGRRRVRETPALTPAIPLAASRPESVPPLTGRRLLGRLSLLLAQATLLFGRQVCFPQRTFLRAAPVSSTPPPSSGSTRATARCALRESRRRPELRPHPRPGTPLLPRVPLALYLSFVAWGRTSSPSVGQPAPRDGAVRALRCARRPPGAQRPAAAPAAVS